MKNSILFAVAVTSSLVLASAADAGGIQFSFGNGRSYHGSNYHGSHYGGSNFGNHGYNQGFNNNYSNYNNRWNNNYGNYGNYGRSNYGGHYHDTSHYDYHAPSLQRHGNHYDYVPGHYDFHQTGHHH